MDNLSVAMHIQFSLNVFDKNRDKNKDISFHKESIIRQCILFVSTYYTQKQTHYKDKAVINMLHTSGVYPELHKYVIFTAKLSEVSLMYAGLLLLYNFCKQSEIIYPWHVLHNG